jgi:hypothetical protein
VFPPADIQHIPGFWVEVQGLNVVQRATRVAAATAAAAAVVVIAAAAAVHLIVAAAAATSAAVCGFAGPERLQALDPFYELLHLFALLLQPGVAPQPRMPPDMPGLQPA